MSGKIKQTYEFIKVEPWIVFMTVLSHQALPEAEQSYEAHLKTIKTLLKDVIKADIDRVVGLKKKKKYSPPTSSSSKKKMPIRIKGDGIVVAYTFERQSIFNSALISDMTGGSRRGYPVFPEWLRVWYKTVPANPTLLQRLTSDSDARNYFKKTIVKDCGVAVQQKQKQQTLKNILKKSDNRHYNKKHKLQSKKIPDTAASTVHSHHQDDSLSAKCQSKEYEPHQSTKKASTSGQNMEIDGAYRNEDGEKNASASLNGSSETYKPAKIDEHSEAKSVNSASETLPSMKIALEPQAIINDVEPSSSSEHLSDGPSSAESEPHPLSGDDPPVECRDDDDNDDVTDVRQVNNGAVVPDWRKKWQSKFHKKPRSTPTLQDSATRQANDPYNFDTECDDVGIMKDAGKLKSSSRSSPGKRPVNSSLSNASKRIKSEDVPLPPIKSERRGTLRSVGRRRSSLDRWQMDKQKNRKMRVRRLHVAAQSMLVDLTTDFDSPRRLDAQAGDGEEDFAHSEFFDRKSSLRSKNDDADLPDISFISKRKASITTGARSKSHSSSQSQNVGYSISESTSSESCAMDSETIHSNNSSVDGDFTEVGHQQHQALDEIPKGGSSKNEPKVDLRENTCTMGAKKVRSTKSVFSMNADKSKPQQHSYQHIQSKSSDASSQLRRISNLSSVSDVTPEQLTFLVKHNEKYLRQIFQGKQHSWRHEDYKKGARARVSLKYQIPLGEFTDTQSDTIMENLILIFCSKHDKYFDYVTKVMWPEALLKIHMTVHGCTSAEAEEAMRK